MANGQGGLMVSVSGIRGRVGEALTPEIVAQYAAVGVNWWIEDVSPYRFGLRWEDPWTSDVIALMRERVRRGPPRESLHLSL